MPHFTVTNLTGDSLSLDCPQTDLKKQISMDWGIPIRLIHLQPSVSEKDTFTLIKENIPFKIGDIIYVLRHRTIPSSHWQRSVITEVDPDALTFIVNYLNKDETLVQPEYPYQLGGKMLRFDEYDATYVFPEILKEWQRESNWIGFNQKRQYIIPLTITQRTEMLNILNQCPMTTSRKWYQTNRVPIMTLQNEISEYLDLNWLKASPQEVSGVVLTMT